MTNKTYTVHIGLHYKHEGVQHHCVQLLRDGKAIATADYQDGVRMSHMAIDGLSRELAIYFYDEGNDLVAAHIADNQTFGIVA